MIFDSRAGRTARASGLALAVAGFALLVGCESVWAAEFKTDKECVVGSKVSDRKNKVGTVLSVKSSMCKVRFEDGSESSYLFWMLRPAGTSAVTEDKLVNGTYKCYSLAGNTLNYAFVDVIIDGPDTYKDKSGSKGKYRLDRGTGKLVFESGPLSKATAKLLAGPKIGLNMNGGTFYNTTCSLKK